MDNNKSNTISEDEKLSAEILKLTDIISRHVTEEDGPVIKFQQLLMRRINSTTEISSYIYEPCICVVANGAKKIIMDKEEYTYDKYRFLVSSVDMPLMAQVIDVPYLGIAIKLDMQIIAELMAEKNLPQSSHEQTERAIGTSMMTYPLLNAVTRFVALLDEPEENIPIMAPVIQKEIIFRLLISDQGKRLKQSAGAQTRQVSHAVEWIREHYSESINIEKLAKSVYMSNSSFHQHFRSLTAMTPLQYQKKLRLHEARKLMLSENFDASSAAYEVGYESPSQFSREYSRLFGNSPLRDIKNLNMSS